MQPLELRPEMATLTTGTGKFWGRNLRKPRVRWWNSFARAFTENGVKPEIEIFEAGMINNALALVKKGLLKMPLHFDFVMGVPGGDSRRAAASPPYGRDLCRRDATWSVAGIGRSELPLATMAILLGGHVRVGFEDNVFL